MKRSPLKRHTPLRAFTPIQAHTGLKAHTKIRLRATTKRPRRVKSPLAKAKDALWELCKQITRATYGNVCYTCYQDGLHGSNWHTGHFITDSVCSTELSYDLKNLRPQCYHCNINLSGNWVEFERRLIDDHGQAYIDELKLRNRETKGLHYGILWYQAKIAEYENLVARA